MIPYGRQSISDEDIAAVVEVLRSDWLTQGPAIPAFEDAVRAHTGAPHAIAVSNATVALHLACLALDLGPGDRLWTSPNTFVASANCGLYCGATVDFVDIDPLTLNMSVAALETKLEQAEREGRLPRVVVPVHFAGQSCDMRAIHALARRYGFRIIEDASHAIGGSYLGEPVGGGQWSDITVFSFHPVKIITTGEGGMCLTRDATLAARLRRLRSHGITREPNEMEGAPQGGWYYEQVELGYNARMTDIQAALGASQMGRLAEFIARRRVLADRYETLLAGFPLITPGRTPDADSSWHLYVIRLTQEAPTRRAVYDALRAAGIGAQVHYIPVHLQPHYRRLGFRPGDFPHAESYYASALSLPIFPALSDAQQDRVVQALEQAVRPGA
ncbi:MAG: UDP-4-amino-4,6-dideoxy-N-acetyl-beta-L-altrosamine transaminase [Pseudomonadota bacterium]